MIDMDNSLNGIFDNKAKSILELFGFEYDNVDGFYTKRDSAGYVNVSLSYRTPGLKPFVTFVTHRRYDLIEELWIDNSDLLGLGKMRKDLVYTLTLNLGTMYMTDYNPTKRPNYVIELEPSIEAVDAYFIQFKKELTEDIIPFLNRFNDIRQMDAYLNHPPEAIREKMNLFFPYGLEFRKMIIAKLANNPRYDDVVDAMFSLINGAVAQDCTKYQGLLTAYHNVVERLKTVEPLKNPMLGQML